MTNLPLEAAEYGEAVLRRQGAQAREALRTLLVDRFDGTFGGLLASSTWPTTFGGANGPPSLVAGLLTFPSVGEVRAA